MFTKIRARIITEYSHYLKLTLDARRLLLSHFLFTLAYPLFDVFTNAFLWRKSGSLTDLVIYNSAGFVGILLGFYLNGLALRRFRATHLFALGLFFQGLSALMVVFISSITPFSILIYGLVAGLGGGFFWANKNYLSLRLSRGSNRLYYNSIEYSMHLIIKIISPLLAGGIIALGLKSSLYSVETAYKIVMFLGFLFIFASGYIINNSNIKDISHENLLVRNPTTSWNLVRLYSFLWNIISGVEFIIPTVLVLVLLGQEGTLGLVTSAAAALSAASLYVLGRKGGIKNVLSTVVMGNTIYAIGTILLALFFNPLTALIYMAAATIGKALRFSPPYSVVMEIMDRDNESGQYAYICDQEIFFNLGRLLGMGMIVYFASHSAAAALQYIPPVLGAIALLSLYPLNRMIKSIKN